MVCWEILTVVRGLPIFAQPQVAESRLGPGAPPARFFPSLVMAAMPGMRRSDLRAAPTPTGTGATLGCPLTGGDGRGTTIPARATVRPMEGRGTMVAAREEVGGRHPSSGIRFTFLPGDPPRCGQFAAFRLHDRPEPGAGRRAPSPLSGIRAMIDSSCPLKKSVRRRQVPAVLLPVAAALPLLLDVEAVTHHDGHGATWGERGHRRSRPHRPGSAPSGGQPGWRWTPGGPARSAPTTTSSCGQLAEAMPPLGHAVALEEGRRRFESTPRHS